VSLDTPAGIFGTWRTMHKVLREEYHMNPRRETDDAYETTRMTAVVANPRGIFGVTPARDVESFPRFWAIGSGTDYALGAMFVMYERTDDVEAIARAGIEAGAEFDDGSELPVILHLVELVSGQAR
jgi:ATP-dependent HslUV protease subunit HslV